MSRNNYRNYYKDDKKDEVTDEVVKDDFTDEVVKDEVTDDVKDEVTDEVVKDDVTDDVKDKVTDEVVKDETTDDVKDDVTDEVNENVSEIVGTVVNCERLNVRKSATRKSQVLKVIEKGTNVIIENDDTSNIFYKVRIDDVVGYCMKDFIEIK